MSAPLPTAAEIRAMTQEEVLAFAKGHLVLPDGTEEEIEFLRLEMIDLLPTLAKMPPYPSPAMREASVLPGGRSAIVCQECGLQDRTFCHRTCERCGRNCCHGFKPASGCANCRLLRKQ